MPVTTGFPVTGMRYAPKTLEESVWADIRGRPLTDRSLAVRPRGYEISSKDVRVGEWHGKGYAREDFHDAWQRYLPQPAMEAATSETEL